MRSKPRILVVDDQKRFRDTMCKLLNLKGFPAIPAGSGPEAISKVQTDSYDVVILDVRMPEMGGIDVLAKLKGIDPELEVIIMTGYASVDTAKDLMRLGAYDYMLKPYNGEVLVDKIEAAYDRKTTRLKLTAAAQEEKNTTD